MPAWTLQGSSGLRSALPQIFDPGHCTGKKTLKYPV